MVGGLCLALTACSAAFAGCTEGRSATLGALPESAEARARLADLRQRFVRGTARDPVLVIGTGTVESFQSTAGGRVRAVVAEGARRGVRRPVRVELPLLASDPVYLEDEASQTAIEFALEGAGAAPLAVADGIAMYAGALPGADVVHRAGADGTEDYVVFASRPEREELVYRVDVSRVAGLRLVSRVLEFMDPGGAPRLRVTAPYVVDAAGTRHEAGLAVEGCAYDTDPRGPWGRAVTAPGAAACTVRVSWGEVAYPAMVDPAWMTTNVMNVARGAHTASLLSNGKVLVAGGASENTESNMTPPTVFSAAELYDPVSDTWTATNPLNTPRRDHTASVLSNGQVLVAGGQTSNFVVVASAELYDMNSGHWLTATPMATPREGHTASVLSSGQVLVAGGEMTDQATCTIQSSTELYTPGTCGGAWTNAGSMKYVHVTHTASVIEEGTAVLVTGGFFYGTGVDLYQSGGGWVGNVHSMAASRLAHAATVLDGGQVLVTGGFTYNTDPTTGNNGSGTALASAELYDPNSTNINPWSNAGSMAAPRYGHTASLLSSGKVLVVGGGSAGNIGSAPTDAPATAELYDPATNLFDDAGSIGSPRFAHTASVLYCGAVLIAGGFRIGDGQALGSAEVYFEDPDAGPDAGCSPPADAGDSTPADAGDSPPADASCGPPADAAYSPPTGGVCSSPPMTTTKSLYGGCAAAPGPLRSPLTGAAALASFLLLARGRRRRARKAMEHGAHVERGSATCRTELSTARVRAPLDVFPP
jgi:N-acetylneuraminic acid mutarotase